MAWQFLHIADSSLGTRHPLSLANIFSELHHSLRLRPPSVPSFSLSYHKCETCIAAWSLCPPSPVLAPLTHIDITRNKSTLLLLFLGMFPRGLDCPRNHSLSVSSVISVWHCTCLVIKVIIRVQSIIGNLLSAAARCGCFLDLYPPIVLTCLQPPQIYPARSSLFPSLDQAWLCAHFRITDRSVSVLPDSLLWHDLAHSFGDPRWVQKDCTHSLFVPITPYYPKPHGYLPHSLDGYLVSRYYVSHIFASRALNVSLPHIN